MSDPALTQPTDDALLPFEHPLGATVVPGNGRDVPGTFRPDGRDVPGTFRPGVVFRVWAPSADEVLVRVLTGAAQGDHPTSDAGMGVRIATVEGAAAGDDYVFVLDGEPLPDPASRHQPEGVRGPSRIVDPTTFPWTDDGFATRPLGEHVLYELHIGTFSEDGTFDSAIPHLAALADLGVTAIEIMPVAEFPGRWGWGYDGVYLGAAHSHYGGPEGLARLVDAAHAHGLAVVLDVVHNHLGSTGAEQIAAFGPYFTDKYTTWWGSALNYDDAWSTPVREWVLQSVEWYLRDLHIDGLRLDAVHAMFDQGSEHLVAAVARRAHQARPGSIVIAESALNDPKVIRPAGEGGWGCDAQWADDLHHAVRVLATGERDGYYSDFGTIADLAKALHRPYVHTGEWSPAREKRFGAPADDRPTEQFVVFTQDHDQVGNRALGDRLPREVQPLAALIVLTSPFTPMLFMGEEHGEPAPFQFFSDHIDPEIAEATREGRKREFADFAAFAGEEVPDPQAEATFRRSKLTGQVDPEIRTLYRRLLEVRRELPPGDVDEIAFDEDARWIRFRRGGFHVVASFAEVPSTVPIPADATELVVGTHDDITLVESTVTLPPMGGALLRGQEAPR